MECVWLKASYQASYYIKWKVGGSGEVRLLVCLFVARLEYQITIHLVVVHACFIMKAINKQRVNQKRVIDSYVMVQVRIPTKVLV